MTARTENIDWLYRLDVFYCEFCEATHDATNHIGDDVIVEKRDKYCPNGDMHTHMNYDIINPIYVCTYCQQMITALWKRYLDNR